MALTLFYAAINWIMNNMPPDLGLTVGGHYLNDFVYADDALLIVDPCEQVLPVLERLEEMARIVGMHPFWCKTKIQNINASPN